MGYRGRTTIKTFFFLLLVHDSEMGCGGRCKAYTGVASESSFVGHIAAYTIPFVMSKMVVSCSVRLMKCCVYLSGEVGVHAGVRQPGVLCGM